MAPVVDEGNARTERFGQCQPAAVIHILDRIERAYAARRGEVPMFRNVSGHTPQESRPNMPVRLNKSRQHDHIGRVDKLRAGRNEARPDSQDFAGTNMHIGIGHVAQLLIHRHDESVAQKIFSARRQTRVLSHCHSRTHQVTPGEARGPCAQGTSQKFATVEPRASGLQNKPSIHARTPLQYERLTVSKHWLGVRHTCQLIVIRSVPGADNPNIPDHRQLQALIISVEAAARDVPAVSIIRDY